jgi:membrane-associated protease RseP (regulator of RpoE activity)
VRLIVQAIGGSFELCARLGLVLAPTINLTQVILFGISRVAATVPFDDFPAGKFVHAVLESSPAAEAGILRRDIIVAVNGEPWEAVRLLTFSDRRPSEILLQTFVARYFATAEIRVRVPPEPYRPLDKITKEVTDIIAARPALDVTPYRNPRDDLDPEMARLWESIRRRLRMGRR